MNTPTVNFIYAYPLDAGRRKIAEYDGVDYPSIVEVKEKIKHWKEIWADVNTDNRVIKLLADVTNRVPERSLECFVFGGDI